MNEQLKNNSQNPLPGEDLESVYFIGIGGIGMSALARYFKAKGVRVSGYDKTPTALTRQLEKEGISIQYTDDAKLITLDAKMVVYTPAIPATHAGLVYYRQYGYPVVKRSDVLEWITANSFNICVAGTHGKTTVSTMIAHILRDSGYGCNAFLGGIAANYGTNFWSSEKNAVVVEADEYDRSFLKLSPDIAVITAMDPDHLDIYGTPEAVEDAFIEFSQKIKTGGCLVSKYGLKRTSELNIAQHTTYSYDAMEADVHAENMQVQVGAYLFDIVSAKWKLKNVVLHMGGLHNIENVIAAVAVAKYVGIDDDKIKTAVENFKGVKRRFEYIIKNEKRVLIDDYAHHPEELRALISGVRSLFPTKKMTIVFQPHLFSRTKDLALEFAHSLDMADEVILLPIYPARELPMEGVTSKLILDQMKLADKHIMDKEELKKWVKDNQSKLLVMAGAGDIDAMVQPIKELMESNDEKY